MCTIKRENYVYNEISNYLSTYLQKIMYYSEWRINQIKTEKLLSFKPI